MGSARVFSQVPLVALGWLCVMLPWVWPSRCRPGGARPAPPLPALRKRSHAPNPFAGLTHQPHCAACEHAPAPAPPPLQPPPPASCPRRGADARSTPRARAAPPRTVRIGAGGLGASPRHWSAQWRPLAAAAGHRRAPLVSRDPGPALAWPPPGGRAQRARPRVPGRRAGAPGHRPGMRGRSQPGAAMVSGGRRAAPGLFTPRPARRTGPAGAPRCAVCAAQRGPGRRGP